MVEFRGISWAGVPVDDFDAAVSFFRDRLGVSVSYLNDDHQTAHFRMANGDLVELFGPDNPREEHRRHMAIALEVEDIERARSELESRGVEFVSEIRTWKQEAWCYFVGPDGLLFEIHSRDTTI
jgi:catechol 2,3-dioxygenase-like lactoylglutathione lyase family enzyme